MLDLVVFSDQIGFCENIHPLVTHSITLVV